MDISTDIKLLIEAVSDKDSNGEYLKRLGDFKQLSLTPEQRVNYINHIKKTHPNTFAAEQKPGETDTDWHTRQNAAISKDRGIDTDHPVTALIRKTANSIKHSYEDHPIAAAGGVLAGIAAAHSLSKSRSNNQFIREAVSDSWSDKQYYDKIYDSLYNTNLTDDQRRKYANHLQKTHPNTFKTDDDHPGESSESLQKRAIKAIGKDREYQANLENPQLAAKLKYDEDHPVATLIRKSAKAIGHSFGDHTLAAVSGSLAGLAGIAGGHLVGSHLGKSKGK
jgi:uncharacterized short protein YbdD (DUF466 family)